VPTYQYTCTECAHDLEAVQKFTDDALTECPECTGRLRKVFSAVGVVFKGSGFYRTDSRQKSSSSSPSSDKPSGDKSSGDSSPGAANKAKANSEPPYASKKESSSSAASSSSSSSSKGGESAA
jgi:putative FmdB family regulatory protein